MKNGIVAAAIARPDRQIEVLGETVTVGRGGFVAFFDAASGALIDRIRVGNLPDMLTFTADGEQLLVANEAEFNSDRGLDRDPVGSVSVISLKDLNQITTRRIDSRPSTASRTWRVNRAFGWHLGARCCAALSPSTSRSVRTATGHS